MLEWPCLHFRYYCTVTNSWLYIVFWKAKILETLSTTTEATMTAYRKQIFCSGHAQKLNNWLQPAVVFTLATPYSLFWRSADNVSVYCKVFSPFFDLPFFFRTTHNEGPFWRLLSNVFWGEILQWTSLRQKNTLAQAASWQIHRKAQSKLEEIHSVRSITFISSVL